MYPDIQDYLCVCLSVCLYVMGTDLYRIQPEAVISLYLYVPLLSLYFSVFLFLLLSVCCSCHVKSK